MSDATIAAAGAGEGRRSLSRASDRHGRRRPALRWLAAILAPALGIGAAYAFRTHVAPLLRIGSVSIAGNGTVPGEDILRLADLSEGATLFDVDTARIARAVAADPRIRTAVVKRILPDTIDIRITERVPVASILLETGGRTVQLLADREGALFRYADGRDGAGSGHPLSDRLPVLSGIRFEEYRPGQTLPGAVAPILDSLERISGTAFPLISAFSEIRIVRLGAGDLELLLYPVHVPIPVRTKADLDEETLRSVLLVLDILRERFPAGAVEELDFRTGTVVYRTKEDHPG